MRQHRTADTLTAAAERGARQAPRGRERIVVLDPVAKAGPSYDNEWRNAAAAGAPFVSIIIPVLNEEAVLEKCLISIRTNRTQHSYEIIVVDAGSTDRSREIAGWYANKVVTGKSHTIDRNAGIAVAAGQVICFTDADCIVPEHWLDSLVGGLLGLNARDGRIVGVGGPNVPVLTDPGPLEIAITRAMRSPFISFKARNTAIYGSPQEVSHNPPMNSACFKRVLLEVEGFVQRPGFPEDLDLDARITERGYKLYYLPDAPVHHRHKTNRVAFARQMRDFGMKRCSINRCHKRLSRPYHYGPLVLCLMLYSPLCVVPLGLALANALFVSIRDGAFKFFLPVARLTLDFYRNYGLGEIQACLRRNVAPDTGGPPSAIAAARRTVLESE